MIVSMAPRVLTQAADIKDIASADKDELEGAIFLGTLPSIEPKLLPASIPLLHELASKLPLCVDERSTPAWLISMTGCKKFGGPTLLASLYAALKRWVGLSVPVDTLISGEDCIVRSRGLVESGLPEVEIAGCPPRLREVAANLVSSVATNGESEPESLKVGKVIGARFVSARQPLVETFRLIKSCADQDVLRVVDVEENSTAFPHRLVATHLCATADKNRSEALRLLLVSVEIWGQENTASNAALGDFEVNPNNFWSWVDLGTALASAQKLDEAIPRWKIAVCMWPRGGKLYAGRMLERSKSRPAWNTQEKAAAAFWKSVSNDSIKAWCAELGVGLSDSALAD